MSTIAESGASTETVVDPHELYRTRIEPAILPLEEERLRILRRRTTTLVAILGGTAVLVLILLLSGAAFAIWRRIFSEWRISVSPHSVAVTPLVLRSNSLTP